MKDAFKLLAMAFINAMILMTLILAPVPGINGGDSISAYAESSDSDSSSKTSDKGCEDDGAQPSNDKVYRPGCQFSKDLSKTDLKDAYSEGMVGIIEQFVGAAFAMVGVTLFFNPISQIAAMCPQNVGAAITFPIVQVGCLTYVLGEVAANSEFKEASKIAVDKQFSARKATEYDRSGNKEARAKGREQAKKNQEANNKQLAAYDALEEIYSKQASGLKKKVMGATLAEVAFVTATALEIKNIMGMEASCTAFKAETKTKDETLRGQLTGDIAALGSQGATYSSNTATAAMATQCYAAQTGLAGYKSLIDTQTMETIAESNAEAAEEGTKAAADNAGITGFFSKIVSSVVGLITPAPKHTAAEGAANKTKAGVNDTADAAKKSERAAMISQFSGSLGGCPPVGPPILAKVQAIELNRQLPAFCCGTHTIKGATLDSSNSLTAYNDEVKDAITVLNSTSEIRLKKNEKYYVKVMVENLLKRVAYENIKRIKNITPLERIQKIAQSDSYIQYIMDNQDALLNDSNLKKEYEYHLKQLKEHDPQNIEEFLFASISQVKQEMIIASANAMDFMSLLNLGVKAAVLYYLMGDWLRENAFPKPVNRAWTWGIMAGITAVILMFNSKSLKEAEKRRDLVRKERERFLASHAELTRFAQYSDPNKPITGTGKSVNDGTGVDDSGSGVMQCAVAKGNGFAPALCPSVIPRKRISLTSGRGLRSLAGKNELGALNALETASFAAGTKGMNSKSDALSDASLGSISSMSKAIKKQNEGLIKKYDKLQKDRANKLKNKRAKPISLAKSMTKFKKLYSGDPNSSAVSSMQLPSGTASLSDKLEKLKKKKAAEYQPQNFKAKDFQGGTAKSDFDFDVSGGEGGTSIAEGESATGSDTGQALEDFVLDDAGINEKPHVNIFKLISNRYFIKYPALLNERPSKKK